MNWCLVAFPSKVTCSEAITQHARSLAAYLLELLCIRQRLLDFCSRSRVKALLLSGLLFQGLFLCLQGLIIFDKPLYFPKIACLLLHINQRPCTL